MRPEDEYPYDRNARALVSRVGTVTALNGTKVSVAIPGGTLTDVDTLRAPIAYAVNQRVLILLDRNTAIVVGILN